MVRKLRLGVVIAMMMLVMAPMASAATGDCKPKGYCGEAGRVQGQLASQQSGQLPFTGLEVGVFAAAGAMLVGAGAFVRRAARHKSE